jgi:putative ABC transport system permease protein
MSKWRAWVVRLAGTFRKSASESELSAELESHLQLHIADNLRAGMLPEEARRHALMKLGGMEQTKEAYRDRRGLRWLETIWQDLRMAFRTLRLRPGFAATTVLTLALGIGATTAVFSVVDRILFRSLPYPQDERLVSFGVKAPFEGNEFMLAPEYAVLRTQPGPFESTTSLTPGGADCDLTEADPVRLNCAVVEATFLSTFGIHPVVGRDFAVDDGRTGAACGALISYGLWRARFGGDSGVARRTISIDGKPVQIIGVLPQDFEMPNLEAVDLLLPQVLDEAALDRNHPRVILRAFGRLRPSVTIEQAIAGLQPWFQDSLRFVPPQFRSEVSLRVRSLRERQTADSRAGAWLLFGAVTAVLLLGCTNVTNLLLVRAVGRQRELAVRAVLGASRVRLARQILTEALVLAFLGGIAGLGVAYGLLRAVVIIAPGGILRLQQASLDFRVLGFCAAVTLIAAVFLGVAPALSKPAPEWLAGRATTGAARGWFRHALVAGQIAGSLILLAGAAMLLRSLWNIQNVQTGLDTRHVLTAQISLAAHSYPDPTKQMAFFQEVETRLNRVPGIEMIALSDTLPPSGRMQATFFASIDVPGRPRPAQGTGGMVGWRMVTPSYFAALGIPIVRGRGFTEADRAPAEQPVILSQTLAARMFPGEDALGKRMRFTAFDREGGWRTVVGIAGDVKNNGLTSSTDPEFYIPWKNDPGTYAGRGFVILRSSLNAASVAAWVRSEIAGIDPRVPMEFATMETRVGKLASRPRFDAFLLSFFAAMGVLLAALGIYGVVSFLVSQRTAEIGVRMALGATPRSISRLVLLSMAKWTVAGAAAGTLGAWFCVRLLQSLLFEVRAHDPVLLLTAVVILLAVAIGAAWIPARRAAKVDPMVALRYD